jgi:hypothetical protein
MANKLKFALFILGTNGVVFMLNVEIMKQKGIALTNEIERFDY